MVAKYDFDWHEPKALSNLAKHGVSFLNARRVFLDPHRIDESTAREQDQEDRRKVTGRIGAKLFTVVYTVRPGNLRWIISARRANRKEERSYGTL